MWQPEQTQGMPDMGQSQTRSKVQPYGYMSRHDTKKPLILFGSFVNANNENMVK